MPGKARKRPFNPTVIGDWAQQWHRQLHRFLARRLPSEADTQDLAQEVYLRLLRFDGTDLVQRPQAYLCKIAAHVACEWQLKARQSKPHSSAALDELAVEDTLEDAIDLDLRRRRVRTALQELPAKMRVALMLQHRDGLSYEEIACELGTSLRAVRRCIEEGYARLRKQLHAQQGESS